MRHGDAEARRLDHLEIIVVVADRHHPVEGDAEVRGEMGKRRPFRRSHGQELQVMLRRVHEPRIVPEQSLEIGAKHAQVPPMPDEEPLHEGAQSEEVLGIGDHVGAQPLVVAELPDGQRPIEAVELLVAEEDRVHGRGGEELPDLGEDAARQLTPEELHPRRITDEPAIVVDDGQSDVERLPVEVHRERHAPGRDGDPEARRRGRA